MVGFPLARVLPGAPFWLTEHLTGLAGVMSLHIWEAGSLPVQPIL
jgi:hypothetical protein